MFDLFSPRLIHRTAAVLCLVALIVLAAPAAFAGSDPQAEKIAAHTLEAMGGADAWNATRFLSFNFFGFRTHHWDRETGRHRLEGQGRDGDAYVILHNIHTREGDVYVNGEKVTGEEKAKRLEYAYSAWINDTYWLLMPYKLRDPGVTLSYEGEEELDGATYHKLKLNFDSVGLTPGDTYFAYINQETGLMDRWAYILESYEEGKPATHWKWLGWQNYGDILLAPTRVQADNGRETSLAPIAVHDHLDDAVFENPAAPGAAD